MCSDLCVNFEINSELNEERINFTILLLIVHRHRKMSVKQMIHNSSYLNS